MEKEKIVVFLDYANINRAATEKRFRLDYQDLLRYMGEHRFLIDAHCYVPINPRSEHRLDRVIEELWRSGYIVTTKVGSFAGFTYKCNFDVEITMDVLKAVYQLKPDIIVLASGDSDFVSLILEVRKSGVRVEVAAFEETAGAEILSKCSGFIDLGVYYDGYLAAQNGDIAAVDSIEEQYKDLIQSQEDEDDMAKLEEEMLQQQGSGLGDGKLAVDQADKQAHVPAPDMVDDLGL